MLKPWCWYLQKGKRRIEICQLTVNHLGREYLDLIYYRSSSFIIVVFFSNERVLEVMNGGGEGKRFESFKLRDIIKTL